MSDTATKTRFALREVTKKRKKPLWFAQMTAIGPMTTPDPKERAEFDTGEEAQHAPCWLHMLTFWEIEEVPSHAS